MSNFEKFLVDNSQEADTMKTLSAEEIEVVAGAGGGNHPDTISMNSATCGGSDPI